MVSIVVVGYPSSGKSSLINSVIKRSVCPTGVKRTTEKPTVYTVETVNGLLPNSKIDAIVSSDDVVINEIIDVPGMSDSGDTAKTFDTITFDILSKADIVIWCTDSRTAFLTTSELAAFNAVRARIDRNASTIGHACVLQIYMTKFDIKVDLNTVFDEVVPKAQSTSGEIESEDSDVLALVREVYTKTGIKPVPFNAFGLSVSQGSEALQRLVLKSCSPTKHNIQFNIKPAIDQLPAEHERAKFRSFIEGQLTTYRNELGARTYLAEPNHVRHSVPPYTWSGPIISQQNYDKYLDRTSHKLVKLCIENVSNAFMKHLIRFILIKTVDEHALFCKEFNIKGTGPYLECMWNTYSLYLKVTNIDELKTVEQDHTQCFRIYNILSWTDIKKACKFYYNSVHIDIYDVSISTYTHTIQFGKLGCHVPYNTLNSDSVLKPLREVLSTEFVNRVHVAREEIGLEPLSEAIILTRILASRTTSEFLSLL